MNIFRKLLIKYTLWKDNRRHDAWSEESLNVRNGYTDVESLLRLRDKPMVILSDPPRSREEMLKEADKWRRVRGLKSVYDLTEEDILDWNVKKMLQPIDLNKHTIARRQSTFLGLNYRSTCKKILEKSPNDVLSSDDVLFLLKKFRKCYRLPGYDVIHMNRANRIVFLHHLAMMMSLDNYKERRSSDLAFMEDEYIGLCCTVNYVQRHFPRTPVEQILLDYVNALIQKWYEYDEEKTPYHHPDGKPYYITWKNGKPFTEWSDVCDAFYEAYLKAQTDFPSYIVTTLPLYTDIAVSGWDDTYADVKRCMRGYFNQDEIYTKAEELTYKRGCNVSVPEKLEKLFYQAVLDGKFDDVHACLRFYKTSAAGILLSYELGVLPFELDKIVLWYLRQEVMFDAAFGDMCMEYSHTLGEWEGTVNYRELPDSVECRRMSGQDKGPQCVRLIKGWRYADYDAHYVYSITDTYDYTHFRMRCELLTDGVKVSLVGISHQEVLYSAMTNDEDGQHRWNIQSNPERLEAVAKWYQVDTDDLGNWLWDLLRLYQFSPFRDAIREWRERNV